MLLIGDCIEQMRTLEADSVDAIVTDPPYGLEFMGKEWDRFKGEFSDGSFKGMVLPSQSTRNLKCPDCGKWAYDHPERRCLCGGVRRSQTNAFQGFCEQWAREALRVLKPGGHLLAFGGTRMYHRLAAGIEDAGFEVRDTLMWLYGSGFPKSLDVSKAMDKAAGAEREVVGSYVVGGTAAQGKHKGRAAADSDEGSAAGATKELAITAPSTEAAKKWQGWGTALKPAVEPIVLARKPLIGTVAENVLTHGTGALNIDASRIGTDKTGWNGLTSREDRRTSYGMRKVGEPTASTGRWPANILLDEEAAALLDEQSGGASRFFYVAKASRGERNAGLHWLEKSHPIGGADKWTEVDRRKGDGVTSQPAANIHPTVKPVALMKYLIRLVTPKGGKVLDPFLGSGTTAVAAIEEGVEWIGCEREPEYVEIIKARVAAAQPGLGLTLDDPQG